MTYYIQTKTLWYPIVGRESEGMLRDRAGNLWVNVGGSRYKLYGKTKTGILIESSILDWQKGYGPFKIPHGVFIPK